jgi:predicted amidophosphoribosyltransferase
MTKPALFVSVGPARTDRISTTQVSDEHLTGRSVRLVDDIVTTGTTLTAAAELLHDGGGGDVHALALLHTESSV